MSKQGIKEWGEVPLSLANRDNFVTPSNKDIYLLVVQKIKFACPLSTAN
jgi:hypothetical protein